MLCFFFTSPKVYGARPAANITWYNNTMPLDPQTDTEKRTITTKQVKNLNQKVHTKFYNKTN